MSLFVVSMGVLALTGLVSVASRLGKAGESRALAVLLANDLADRLRANPAGVLEGAYDWRPAGYPASVPPPRTPGRLEPQCEASDPCSPSDIAAIDLFRWRQRLRSSLPGGFGYVSRRPGGPEAVPSVAVWVAWTDLGAVVYGESLPAGDCPPGFASHAPGATPRCLHLQVTP